MGKSKSKSATVPSTPSVPSSNWKSLKAAIKPEEDKDKDKKRKRRHSSISTISNNGNGNGKGKEKAKEEEEMMSMSEEKIREKGLLSKKEKRMVPVEEIMKGGKGDWQKETGHYLALDCEMVGVGPSGVESTLARVSIVNYHGHTVLDRFVRPREKVTDYRTWVSGVREEDLRNAPSFIEVQKEVSELLKGRILVGHALSNDTNVLLLSHPWNMTRDTSLYSPLQGLTKTKKPSLKTLSSLILGLDIQKGEHSSVLDARATMCIYRSQKTNWEDSLLKKTHPILVTNTTEPLKRLDYSKLSLTGVGKKKNLVGSAFGVSTVLRHVRNERELLEENGGFRGNDDNDNEEEDGEVENEEKEEEMERERRKKRRTEKDGDLVLGFDFEKPKTGQKLLPASTVEALKKQQQQQQQGGGGGKKAKASSKGASAIKGGGISFKGDREKRPASKSGWWEED
ncbi:hypothetical protein JCM3765_001165 [Sporobolomyces pararoseus]